MRRTRTPTKLTQNTYNGKAIGVTNAPTRLQAEGCWGLGEITTAISNGTAALDAASTWPPNHIIVEYMVIAGGGAAQTGGAGAGGKLEGTDGVITLGTHTCTVGAGGASDGEAGSESSIGSLYVAEGGGGTGNGGSGAGGYYHQGSFGEGIAGQGNDGGAPVVVNNLAGGGGGGAGQAGQNCQAERTGGTGGNGESDSITGSSVTYCGGGGGARYGQGSGAAGGSGGGGNGSYQGGSPSDGTANLGAGGGGGWGGYKGKGGSGIIVVRYKGDRVFSGGTETTSGDYKLHTFTSTDNIILGATG
jgi:hypothetical protein